MKKKILLGLLAVTVVAGGVAGLSAYEAHVINVTAHIENALSVDTEALEFGTVFPQEYLYRGFTISLSQSFLAENQLRLGDVEYKIVQKPKPVVNAAETTLTTIANSAQAVIEVGDATGMAVGDDLAIGYHNNMERGVISDITGNTITLESNLTMTHQIDEVVIVVYKDLCRFLSKIPTDGETSDIGVPSYYNSGSNSCSEPSSHIATGYLVKCYPGDTDCEPGDISDCWDIDLKVPPVDGYVGQDWPASCSDWVVEEDGADYGCDLWIEVTGFSTLPIPEPQPE